MLAMQCRSTSNCSDSCTPKTNQGWIAWLLDKKHKRIIINKNNRLVKLKIPRILNLEYYNYFIMHYNIKPTIESFMEIIKFKQKKSKDESIKTENKDTENKDSEIETKTVYISEIEAGDQLPTFYPEPRDVLVKKLRQTVLATSRKPACMDDFIIPPPYEDKLTLKQKLRAKPMQERKPPPQIIKKGGIKISRPNVTTETLINVVGPKMKISQPNVTTETFIKVVSPKNMYLKMKNVAEKHIQSFSSTGVKHLNPFDKAGKTSTADKVVKKNL